MYLGTHPHRNIGNDYGNIRVPAVFEVFQVFSREYRQNQEHYLPVFFSGREDISRQQFIENDSLLLLRSLRVKVRYFLRERFHIEFFEEMPL